jgi:hypothetical protein
LNLNSDEEKKNITTDSHRKKKIKTDEGLSPFGVMLRDPSYSLGTYIRREFKKPGHSE